MQDATIVTEFLIVCSYQFELKQSSCEVLVYFMDIPYIYSI